MSMIDRFFPIRRNEQLEPLAPHALSEKARAMAADPNRPVFKPRQERLFRFQPKWERPDPNPFPIFRLFSWRRR